MESLLLLCISIFTQARRTSFGPLKSIILENELSWRKTLNLSTQLYMIPFIGSPLAWAWSF